MELVLEMLSAKQFVPTELCSKTFGRNGGLIGRGGECDWAIPDHKRHLSKQHARVSYRNGACRRSTRTVQMPTNSTT